MVLKKIKSLSCIVTHSQCQESKSLWIALNYKFRAVMDCCWISSPGLSLLVQLKSQNPSFFLCGFGNGLDLNPKVFVYF